MISPALKEKFEELFVDDFTKEQYEQWKGENYKPNKIEQWIRYIFLTIICLVFFLFLGWIIYIETGSRVEQEVRDGNFVTYAWKSKQIVKYWSTPVNQLTDSLKTAQKKAAEDFLRILNK